MYKIKFLVSECERLSGSIAGIPCIIDQSTPEPKAGETWLVEITRTNARRTVLYVRPIRPWKDTPEDRRAVVHVHVDFHNGTVRLLNRFTFAVELTRYAALWEDYRLLASNMNAVIIRGDEAIRWNKKGKPPQVLPLSSFATKYKRQPLLGKVEDINRFLANLEDLRSYAIDNARKRSQDAAPQFC